MSDQSGVRRFCCELTLDVVCRPRLVTDDDVPQGVGHRVVERPRGERRVDQQRPAVLGELGVRARAFRAGSRRGRSGGAPSGSRGRCDQAGILDLETGARNQVDRPLPCRWQADQEADPRRPVRRAGSCRAAGCRSGRGSGGPRCPAARRTPASPAPAASRGSGPADEVDPRRQETLRGPSAASRPMAFECLSQASTACSPLTYSISANSRLYWVWPRSASGRLRTHSRYGTTLIDRVVVRQVLDRDRPELDRIVRAGRVISTSSEPSRCDVANRQAVLGPRESRRRRQARREVADHRPGGGARSGGACDRPGRAPGRPGRGGRRSAG